VRFTASRPRAFNPARLDGHERKTMIEVSVGEGDRIELALKAFRRKVQKSGLLKELRDRRHYVKPSIAKKIKSAAAQRRSRKRARTNTH
jgi:small subunit ribosomal protein S21